MTTTPPPARRSVLPSAVALLLVIVLVAAAAFVAGLSVASAGTPGVAAPSVRPTVEGSLPPVETPAGAPAATPQIVTVTCTEPSDAFRLLCETYAKIKADYVDQIDDALLVEGAVEGMVEALPDAYSGYIPPEHYANALDDLSGEFSGIGAEVGIENLDNPAESDSCTVITNACALVIVAPLDGSPAEEAGVRAGDVILAVDGEPTLGSTIQEEVLEVRGESGTDVTLTIRRDDRELDITITRAVIELVAVESQILADTIGYARLAQFSTPASEEFRAALQSLLEQGATEIVFDLRDNPGGFIGVARDVASQFLPEGTLIFTQESGEEIVEWRVESAGVAADPSIEVVVLINEGSASASEIVAAALEEHERATLVGEPTFGKNTVQVWTELPNGGGLRLTTDRWFTPDHDSVAGDGVQPDVDVQAPDETPVGDDPADDPFVQAAIELLSE